MAKVLSEIPVWFNSLEEIESYIKDSLALCMDTAEKEACMINLKQIMVEGMRWYKHLYVGQKAKKKRFTIIQNIRKGRFQAGVHVITPASCGENLMDIYPASLLLTEYYSKKEDLLILGIAADYYEALEVARDIVDEMYHTTGRFSIREFLSNNGQR